MRMYVQIKLKNYLKQILHGQETIRKKKKNQPKNKPTTTKTLTSLSRLLILYASFIPLVELVHADISNTTLEVCTRNKKVVVLLNVLTKDVVSYF